MWLVKTLFNIFLSPRWHITPKSHHLSWYNGGNHHLPYRSAKGKSTSQPSSRFYESVKHLGTRRTQNLQLSFVSLPLRTTLFVRLEKEGSTTLHFEKLGFHIYPFQQVHLSQRMAPLVFLHRAKLTKNIYPCRTVFPHRKLITPHILQSPGSMVATILSNSIRTRRAEQPFHWGCLNQAYTRHYSHSFPRQTETQLTLQTNINIK